MTDFTREGWVRLFRYESATDRAKPLLCRGLRDYLLRLANLQNGYLVRHAPTKEKALDILLRGAGAHDEELPMCREYLLAWLEEGYLRWSTQRRVTDRVTDRNDPRYKTLCSRYGIVISNFVQAQKQAHDSVMANARRQKAYRDRKRGQNTNSPEQLPLPADTTDSNVTRNVTDNVTRNVTRYGQRKKERKRNRKKERRSPLVELAQRYVETPDVVTTAHGAPTTWPAVREVLVHCDTVWNGTTRAFSADDPRVKTVVARFAEGFTPADLKLAIDGSRRSDFIVAHPELQSVKTLLKDGNAVDSYAKLMAEAPGVVSATRVQPPDSGYYAGHGWEQGSLPVAPLQPEDPFKEAADG